MGFQLQAQLLRERHVVLLKYQPSLSTQVFYQFYAHIVTVVYAKFINGLHDPPEATEIRNDRINSSTNKQQHLIQHHYNYSLICMMNYCKHILHQFLLNYKQFECCKMSMYLQPYNYFHLICMKNLKPNILLQQLISNQCMQGLYMLRQSKNICRLFL